MSIRRYPRSSVWMIQAESCVGMRVCALCGGQRGGSGSQLVVGIITEKTIALDIIIIASRTLLKIGRAASV